MPKCIVIADDLTGANATGVLLKKMKYKTFTVLNKERLQLNTLNECDCLIYPTNSRGISETLAYNRVYNVANLLKNDDIAVYSKRIDSTLRGNIGAEIDAILNSLGEDFMAIMVPCFPESGRIVIGGYMLVNGLPLHKTEVALDPKTPVDSSDVSYIVEKQSKYNVSNIMMSDLIKGKETVTELIKQYKNQGSRILIFDCVTQEDLELISDAVLDAGIRFIAVDPGVFTATVTRKIVTPTERVRKQRILAVVGSVNPVTRQQMEEVWLTQNPLKVVVNTKELVESDDRQSEEIRKVVNEVLEKCGNFPVVTVTGDGILPENRLDFAYYAERDFCTIDEISEKINTSFAKITYQICKGNSEFQGLYTSGGDITLAVCKEFDTAGLDLEDEVLPLAAYGKFIRGEFEGLHIITKGGMVGGSNAINKCITYLREKLFI